MIKTNLIVLGGSFAPITKAHLMILINAIEDIQAQTQIPTKGLLCPSSDQYILRKLQRQKELDAAFYASYQFRHKPMKELLNTYDPMHAKLDITHIELQNKHRSGHTLETLDQLAMQHKQAQLYFIMGADKIKVLRRWGTCDTLLSRHKIAVIPRPGFNLTKDLETYFPNQKNSFQVLSPTTTYNISSTQVRKFAKDKNYDLIEHYSCKTTADLIKTYQETKGKE